MAKPSPATLRLCADQLRILATQQEQNAQHCDDLLDGVSKLANSDTWSGPYPTQADGEFTSWQSGLTASAREMRSAAAGWRRAATHFDAEADSGAASGAAS